MKSLKNIKKGDVVKVIFSVGPKHPIYNKEVDAVIDFIGGYDGHQVHAHTVEPVHHPADPEGIYCYTDDGKFIGFKERAAYDEIWEGYVEQVIK